MLSAISISVECPVPVERVTTILSQDGLMTLTATGEEEDGTYREKRTEMFPQGERGGRFKHILNGCPQFSQKIGAIPNLIIKINIIKIFVERIV